MWTGHDSKVNEVKNIKMKIRTIIIVLLCLSQSLWAQRHFIHPGLLCGNADIERIKAGLAAGQPDITAGFEPLKNHPESQFNYRMQGPLVMVGRNPTVGQGKYDSDANAAFQNALMWNITGDIRYARKAIEIVNAWSSTLKSVTGRDAVLMAGLGPFKMVNAAELLRYSGSGWAEADIKQTERHFKEVIYPVINEFAPFANGNWDSAAMKTVMAIAIFCNDSKMFESALDYYEQGGGDGRLTNYIINEEGQCQESGRDQGHTQLGIAHLADCCEMAWHQGLDLYGLANNRLLKGFEYTAKYNLGYDVPFTPTIDGTGKYVHKRISDMGRGKLRAVYEEIYNHYVKRAGLAAPFTAEATLKVRPESQGLPGADHVGFGTLLYSRNGPDKATDTAPSQPAGLITTTGTEGNFISWVPVIHSQGYMVKRALSAKGPYLLLAKNINTPSYLDKSAVKGQLYYYTVNALNNYGESDFTSPVGCFTGLSAGWTITEPELNGDKVNRLHDTLFATGQKHSAVSFDGDSYTIVGCGTGLDSAHAEATYISKPFDKEGTISLRYKPQFSAQSTQFGIAVTGGKSLALPAVILLVSPQAKQDKEAPGWRLKLLKSDGSGKFSVTTGSEPLAEPFVTFGRMTGPLWLRLEKHKSQFSAYYSTDGKAWISAGTITAAMNMPVYAGLIVASGNRYINTQIVFDHLVGF